MKPTMRKRIRRNRAAALLTFLFATSVSVAHEQKTALTDIFFNERTGNLEVAHRFSLHDAEHVAQKATGQKDDLTKSEGARKAFAEYAADHFELTNRADKVIELALVGEEIEGGYLWVYQEAPIPDLPFFIKNTILLEVIKGQVNTVNIRKGKNVSTAVFRLGSGKTSYPEADAAKTP